MSLRQAIDDLQRRIQRRNRRFHYYLQGEDLSFLRHIRPDQLPEQVRQLQESGVLRSIDQQSIEFPRGPIVAALRFLKTRVSEKFQAVVEGLRNSPS